MIKVSNLTKYYGNKLAVDNISFELEDGKIYGFLGPNGAGKSTTMNIMTGYIGASEGTVLINGYDILEEPEKAKMNMGYLPEIPPLYTDMTVDEYLLFIAELKKVPKSDRKNHIKEIEEKTGLSEVHGRLIRFLSKGYRQRVGFAAALVSDPDVIILDEPTVGLDPIQLGEMRDLIRSLRKNHTVILSSHIMQEVSAVCDIILIIVGGKLVANDTPENLSNLNKGTGIIINYKIKAEKDIIAEVLSTFKEITSVSYEEKDNIIECRLMATTEDAEKLQNDIFFAFADRRIAILESKTEEQSLEDIFMGYATGGEA